MGVAELSPGPVDVLQHALHVVRGLEPEQFAAQRLHGPGQLEAGGFPRRSWSSGSVLRTMCRLYVTSSASTRMGERETRLLRRGRLRRAPQKAAPEMGLEPRVEAPPEGKASADEVFQSRDWLSCSPWRELSQHRPVGPPAGSPARRGRARNRGWGRRRPRRGSLQKCAW